VPWADAAGGVRLLVVMDTPEVRERLQPLLGSGRDGEEDDSDDYDGASLDEEDFEGAGFPPRSS
jgi:hypothetical protein